MREHGGDETDLAYVLSADRLREALEVAPCAARWVEGEMDPTRRLTVARGPSFGPLGAPPSLAEKLGARLQRRDADDRAVVAFAVCKAVAIGYLAYAETEERAETVLLDDRMPAEIWKVWVTSCRAMLEDIGIPKDWANMVRRMGGGRAGAGPPFAEAHPLPGWIEDQPTRPVVQPSRSTSAHCAGRRSDGPRFQAYRRDAS